MWLERMDAYTFIPFPTENNQPSSTPCPPEILTKSLCIPVICCKNYSLHDFSAQSCWYTEDWQTWITNNLTHIFSYPSNDEMCLYTVSDGKAKIKVKAGRLIAGIKKKAKYYLAKLAVSFDLNYLLTSDCSHVFMGRLDSPHIYIYFLLFAE